MNNIQFPKGFSAWGISAGIKTSKGPDLGVICSIPAARTFGAFTRNKFAAAPVLFCGEVLSSGVAISHVLVNSGNANASTGKQGISDAKETAAAVRRCFPGAEGILIASTGIIGHLLPMKKIIRGIEVLSGGMNGLSTDSFSQAILTTDTVKKTCQTELSLGGRKVRIGGTAKGAGMICPDMATMLAFISTDILLPADYKKTFLKIVEKSFNSISVDGDMSTNDTVLLMSNGASEVQYSRLSHSAKRSFDKALEKQMMSLARQIIQDGEGATKIIQISVKGAADESSARNACRRIAGSPLVKTAFFGNDPNWGRVIAALGSEYDTLKHTRIDLSFCGVPVLKGGLPVMFSAASLSSKLKKKEVFLEIQLHAGRSAWTYWTCDLTYDYIKINAEYHT